MHVREMLKSPVSPPYPVSEILYRVSSTTETSDRVVRVPQLPLSSPLATCVVGELMESMVSNEDPHVDTVTRSLFATNSKTRSPWHDSVVVPVFVSPHSMASASQTVLVLHTTLVTASPPPWLSRTSESNSTCGIPKKSPMTWSP